MAFDISPPVIDTTGALATLSAPVINNLGTLAFFGVSDSGERAVYTSRNSVLTEIVNNSFLNGSFGLNNNDATAYVVSEILPPVAVGNITLFLNQNNSVSTITSVFQDRLQSRGISGFQVNDSNNAVVQTVFNAPTVSVSEIILFKADGTSETIASAGSFSSFTFSSLQNPVINNQNVVAYIGKARSTSITSIYTTDGRTISFANGEAEKLVINDQGSLLFSWNKGPDSEELYQNANSQTTLLASTAGLFNDFNTLSFNDQGKFAFNAILDSGVEGIFMGADPIQDRIIAVGDTLANSTVVDLDFSNQGLNDANVITFWAQLANGTSGIFTATRQDGPPNPNVIDGTDKPERLVGTANVDLIDGKLGRDTLIGLAGNDQLLGGGGKDTLIGVDPDSTQPNLNEIDRLVGGKGADTFVLGDRGQIFYNDGNAETRGIKSYAAIADFGDQDIIQLKGRANQYLLKTNFSLAGKMGTGIFFKDKVNELIGFVEGVNDLTLNSANFKFVQGLPTALSS
jgi:hypothetical protein